jgi:hypothetical protein
VVALREASAPTIDDDGAREAGQWGQTIPGQIDGPRAAERIGRNRDRGGPGGRGCRDESDLNGALLTRIEGDDAAAIVERKVGNIRPGRPVTFTVTPPTFWTRIDSAAASSPTTVSGNVTADVTCRSRVGSVLLSLTDP